MLSVDHYEVIRRKVRDGFSQREAAEQLGHGRNTVAKALKYPIPPWLPVEPTEGQTGHRAVYGFARSVDRGQQEASAQATPEGQEDVPAAV